MVRNWIVLALAALVSALQPAAAETYYAAPIGAVFAGTPNGTIDHPFLSVALAFASGKIVAGDTLLLMDGDYAALQLTQSFASTVTIQSQNTRKARVESIYLSGAAHNLLIRNLRVWYSIATTRSNNLVETSSTTSDITFANLDVRSGVDAYNYESWSAAEWLARRSNGAWLNGTRVIIKQSNFTAVGFGILVVGTDGQALGNTVDGFSADGMRGGAPRGIFRDNIIQNCVSVDDNHADGFQSYSTGTVTGLVLERNMFIEWNLAPSHPLRCGLQGIGIFDGFHENVTITNNVVAIRNGHGISIMGLRNALINNNTVVNIDGIQPGYPWIAVYNSKTGVQSTDVIVANNLAMAYAGANDKVNRIQFINNRVVRSVSHAYPDWQTFNYAPRPETRFIDAADPLYAPELDVLRHPRPIGAGPDLGAYEVSSLALPEALSDTVISPPAEVSAAGDLAEAAASTTSTTAKTTSSAKFLKAP